MSVVARGVVPRGVATNSITPFLSNFDTGDAGVSNHVSGITAHLLTNGVWSIQILYVPGKESK